MDYVAKSCPDEMYPKERESYWDFRRDFDIEMIAQKKHTEKQKKDS